MCPCIKSVLVFTINKENKMSFILNENDINFKRNLLADALKWNKKKLMYHKSYDPNDLLRINEHVAIKINHFFFEDKILKGTR